MSFSTELVSWAQNIESAAGINKKFPEHYKQLLHETAFLPKKSSFKQRLWHVQNNTYEYPKCLNCKSPVKWSSTKHRYSNYCSNHCRMIHSQSKAMKQNFRQKYNCSNPMEISDFKQKQSETYKNVDQSAALEKREKTNRQKYNVSSFSKTNKFKYNFSEQQLSPLAKKLFSNNLALLKQEYYQNGKSLSAISEQYDVYIGTISNKLKQNNHNIIDNRISVHAKEVLYNRDKLFNLHHVEQKTLTEIATNLNVDLKTVCDWCSRHQIKIREYTHRSYDEKQIVDFLFEEIGLLPNDVRTNDKHTISPQELDIVIPSKNIAIEYCGLYWHSSKFKHPSYHKNKLDACNRKGLTLITIFEDEWREKPTIVKDKLKQIIGPSDKMKLHARECKAEFIDIASCNQFLEKNHIQGGLPLSQTYHVGLFYRQQLVGVLTIVKRKEQLYEVTRYATNSNVRGGYSKLQKFVERNCLNSGDVIITFADKRWSEGKLYETIGMNVDRHVPPDYSYVINNSREHKFNYRHKYLKDKLDCYDPQLSEKQNTENNQIYRIYNCGLIRFYKTVK